MIKIIIGSSRKVRYDNLSNELWQNIFVQWRKHWLAVMCPGEGEAARWRERQLETFRVRCEVEPRLIELTAAPLSHPVAAHRVRYSGEHRNIHPERRTDGQA